MELLRSGADSSARDDATALSRRLGYPWAFDGSLELFRESGAGEAGYASDRAKPFLPGNLVWLQSARHSPGEGTECLDGGGFFPGLVPAAEESHQAGEDRMEQGAG